MTIRSVWAEYHADRQTDGHTYMTKLIVVFRNFANGHKSVATCTFPNAEDEGIIMQFVSSLFTYESAARGPITEAAHTCIKCIPSLVCTSWILRCHVATYSYQSEVTNVIYIIIAFFWYNEWKHWFEMHGAKNFKIRSMLSGKISKTMKRKHWEH